MAIGIAETILEPEMQESAEQQEALAAARVPFSSIPLILSDQDLAFQRWLIQHEAQMRTGIRHDHTIHRTY
jgi:hypothetical protein